jgi:glycyl-tRNA synthetase beta chain
MAVDAWRSAVIEFFAEREQHLFERRGHRFDEIRAVLADRGRVLQPLAARRRIEALARARKEPEFEALAFLFRRVKNITKGFQDPGTGWADLRKVLKEPAEVELLNDLQRRAALIDAAMQHEQSLEALNQLAALRAPVDRFFVDVLVMTDDIQLREARLVLLARLRDTVLDIADIAEVAPEETR